MTNLTSSIQVSEETLARMGEAAENALMSEQDWVEAGRAAYLAMRSKDHSIGDDEVERLSIEELLYNWQSDQSEWFNAEIREIVGEFARWYRAALVRSKPIDAAQLIANCGFEKMSRDDVREAAKALLIRCDNHARDICEPLFWKEREALRAALVTSKPDDVRALIEAARPFAESIIIDPNKKRGERHWATTGKLTNLDHVLALQAAITAIGSQSIEGERG